jgi:hypothetical protein
MASRLCPCFCSRDGKDEAKFMVKTLQKLERHCDKTTHDLAKAITLKNEVDHTVHEMEEITKKDKSR